MTWVYRESAAAAATGFYLALGLISKKHVLPLVSN